MLLDYIKNVYLLFIRILSVLVIYQLCRLLYLFYNITYFQSLDLYNYIRILTGSIKFDLSAILYLNALLIFLSLIPTKLIFKNWYKKILSYTFIIINSLGIFLNVADVFYYPFAKNRFTISSIEEFSLGVSANKGSFLTQFTLDYWYVIPLMIITVYLLAKISTKTKLISSGNKFSIKSVLTTNLIMLILFTLTVFG